MLPNEYLACNVAAETTVEIIAWKGHCEVHERFSAAEVRQLREDHPGIIVRAHPECPPEVVAEADFPARPRACRTMSERASRRVWCC
jgi:quinolinate synthase